MRDYGKVSSRFWTGDTGRKVRAAGKDCQIVAMYLLTCPSANMIGLYYLPFPTLCHETGLTPEAAKKALNQLVQFGFAKWDPEADIVFVVEMAAHQIGLELKKTDKRVDGIIKQWQSMRKLPFFIDFHARYSRDFHLPASPLQAPCKPLRSQEQEQEQEVDQEKEQEQDLNPSDSSAGQKPAEPARPVALTEFEFPTVGTGKKSWTLPQAKLDEYLAAFPALDVQAEIRAARQWCLDNPRHQKSASGMPRFIGSWLTRAQNRGGSPFAAKQPLQTERPRL